MADKLTTLAQMREAVEESKLYTDAESDRAKAEEQRLEDLFTAPTQEAVDNWLNAHPEATTTVQDGSITMAKLAPAVAENVAAVPDLKSALDEAIEDFAVPTQEAVDNWLGRHPEATTTVQDGSLTYKKLVNGTLNFTTPEMFGAKGDGVTDDTTALKTAFESGGVVLLKAGSTYLVTDLLVENTDGLYVIGYGATIKVKKEFTFQSFLQRCCLRLVECKHITVEGVTFDASWREIKALHNFNVDVDLENYCVRLGEGNERVTFCKCVFGNQLKACIQTIGSWRGGDPSNIDTSFVPNKDIDIGSCVFGWNYTPGHHSIALQMLELPSVATDVNLNFHDNLILQSGEHGIHIYYGNNNLNIENNIVLNSGHEALEDYFIGGGSIVKGYGIEVTSCNKITIKNNTVKNAIVSLIAVQTDRWYTAGDIHDVLIDGNTLEQESSYSEEFCGHGISVQRCDRCKIVNNAAKGIFKTRNNGTDNAGMQVALSNYATIANNSATNCESGIVVNETSDVSVVGNGVINLKNNFGRGYGIHFYNVNRVCCSENVVDNEGSETAEVFGIQVSNVVGGSVSGNILNSMNTGLADGSNTITNVTIYGNIFVDISYKYVWWGTHTGLVVDFVAVPNN